MSITKDFYTAIRASIEAGDAILEVYNSSTDIEISIKADNSPLTEADLASNAIINSYLAQTDHPIISEENTQIPFEKRKDWKSCWIVDPLDGTKEFIKRNGEFTVNIALCKDGIPVLGVIYIPVTRELYYADSTKGEAFKPVMEKDVSATELFTTKDRIQLSPSNPDRLSGDRLPACARG